jgi:hypothetical protein
VATPALTGCGKTIFAPVGLGEWNVRDDCRLAHRMLKKAVLFVRRSSLVSRRSQAENFISCEIRFTRDASRDTVFALADFFSILLSCLNRRQDSIVD